MTANEDVENLFNAKAKAWSEKYQPGGPLTGRAAMFEELAQTFLAPNSRMLDLGCGTGAISSHLAALGFRVTACDIAKEMIETGKQSYGSSTIHWVILSPGPTGLPFASDTFEGIVASSVLEYVADVASMFAECERVLKPGGYLIATVPNPQHFTRRLEKMLRWPLTTLSRIPILNGRGRLHSYGSYLKLSRNRMALPEWFEVSGRAHFSRVKIEENRHQKGALVPIVLRKNGNQQNNA